MVPASVEATGTLETPFTAALEPHRATLGTLENTAARDQVKAENRFRLFEDLSLPPRVLELVQASKTASGVFDLGLGCNIWQTGGLSQNCGGPSFQGLWTDPVTGLSYARNRWYDARTASWLSEDPLGAVDSPNLYAFVGWGPHVGRDPLGLLDTSALAPALLELRHVLGELGIDPLDDIATAGERAIDRTVTQATELTAILPAGDELVADALLYFVGQSAKDTVDVLRMNEGLADLAYGEGFVERAGGLLREANRIAVVVGLIAGTTSAGSRVVDNADDAVRGARGLAQRLVRWFKKEGDDALALADEAPGRGVALQSFPDWRPGGSITHLTKEGSYPRWFSHVAAEKAQTIQGRYWMNRALLESEGRFTARQVAKMKAGFAPQARVQVMVKRTGQMEIRTVSKELHHNLGNRGVPGFDEPLHLRELWPWEHARIDPSRRLDYDFLGFVD